MTVHKIRRCRGGYMPLDGRARNAYGRRRYEALCAEEGCSNTAEVEATHSSRIPLLLRMSGWTVTGERRASLWWCPRHRQEGGR